MEVFREKWWRSIESDATSIFECEQNSFQPNTLRSDVSSMLYACIVHDAVLPNPSYEDPCGFCPWDPQAERILSVCLLFKFVLQISIRNWWWNVNRLHIQSDKCTSGNGPGSKHCRVLRVNKIASWMDFEKLGGASFFLLKQYNNGILFVFSSSSCHAFLPLGNFSEDCL